MTGCLTVPFLDLAAHHAPLRGEIFSAINAVMDASAFAGGPFVNQFESEFAKYCGSRHAVGVSSGTDALWLALVALGIGPGDEVITVPMTFIATAEAIHRTGATPVFVDITPDSFTMDAGVLGTALSPRTRAILPVHLFGQMAPMAEIMDFARANGLFVVEDAAQAHGAKCGIGRAGTLGNAGCFSFYPGKNLGALGDAGAVVTDDDALATRLRILRDHGQTQKYHHGEMGWNCRMDGLQAAVLSVKLRHLSQNNARRRRHSQTYSRHLAGLPGISLPETLSGNTHASHLYVIRVPDRRKFMDAMEARGIGCAIHYPVPVHLQPAFTSLGRSVGSFPQAESCAHEFVSLPMYPELRDEQIEAVVGAIIEFSEREAVLA